MGKEWKERLIEWKEKKQSGFTLVELIVTLALFSILLTIGTVGILGWRDYSDFKRQNEYAQTIFNAAQMQLTYQGANGLLPEIAETMEREVEVNAVQVKNLNSMLSNILLEEGEADASEIWNHSETSTIYAVLLTRQDYEAYQSNEDAVSDAAKCIYDLLDNYLYDKSILDASLAVEFDPQEGLLYSVLYSDKNRTSGFIYDNRTENETGVVNILNRQEAYRKSRMVGYYGVDTLSKAISVQTEKPVISNLRLNNQETLNLTWSLSKVPQAVNELTYEIVIYSEKDNTRPLVQITMNHLSGEDAEHLQQKGFSNTFQVESQNTGLANQTIGAKVVAYHYGEEEQAVTDTVYEQFVAWIDRNNQIHVVLDAVDLTATADVYKRAVNQDVTAQSTLENTYSILRHITENQNIYCMVRGSAAQYKNTTVKQSNVENMLFGSVQETSQFICEIYNARHLYNMRFTESQTAKVQNQYEYRVTSDFAWSGAGSILEQEAVFFGQKTRQDLEISKEAYETTVFPQMEELRVYSTLTSEGNTITGLILSYNADNKSVAGVSGTGLFLWNNGIMKNLNLAEVSVDGTGSVAENGITRTGDATGAFCAFSKGKLENLSVLGGSIAGTDFVGGIFGKMEQPVVTVSVEGSGTLVEQLKQLILEWIKRIVNMPESDTNRSYAEVNYQNLVNHAKVSGRNQVGGIAGQITAVIQKSEGNNLKTMATMNEITVANRDNSGTYIVTKVTLDSCENYGMVYGSGEKIGGILGEDVNLTFDNFASDAEDVDSIKLINCISAPTGISVQEAFEILENTQVAGHFVYESKYVGGIVGCHTIGTLENCTTGTIEKGFVLGGAYVGGIIGIQKNTEIDGVKLNQNKLEYFAGSNSIQVINNNYVIGSSYVGGIAGYSDGVLTKCTNTGVVAGVGHEDFAYNQVNYVSDAAYKQEIDLILYSKYVGGITGYNADTGKIDGCTANVKQDEIAEEIFRKTGNTSDYVGGIAGYNAGTLCTTAENDRVTQIDTDIKGKNCVGGVIGYNTTALVVDENGNQKLTSVSGYAVRGGVVSGKNFVGGYVGLNTSEEILQDKYVESNPSEVTGSYAVGGILGGNIVQTDDEIETFYDADNFQGRITADAYAGGFVGYNLIYSSQDEQSDVYAEQILAVFEQEEHALSVAISEEEKAERIAACTANLEQVYNYVDLSDTQKTADGRAVFVITKPSESSTTAITGGGAVETCMYAGGLVGYSDSNSRLTIRNIQNNMSVTTTGQILGGTKVKMTASGNEETVGVYQTTLAEEKYYSYAGGMIGYASENVIMDACSNKKADEVVSKGTYSGGLCEVNEGTLINCSTNNRGSMASDYVGGLVGLNTEKGRILSCNFNENSSITGRNYIGGLAAENMGRIANPVLSGGTLTVYGTYAGGITGINGGEIETGTGEGEQEREMRVTIVGEGTCVAGLVGFNAGILSTAKEGNRITISADSNIHGKDAAGGAVGYQKLWTAQEVAERYSNVERQKKLCEIAYIVNKAQVSASEGSASGIIGKVNSPQTSTNFKISNCQNSGTITAEKTGDAGGILANAAVQVVIEHCKNDANILAVQGNAGGIAAVNQGTILKSEAGSSESTSDNRKKITAFLNAGGVAGENKGLIKDTRVYGIIVTNDRESTTLVSGGIAGKNTGMITWTDNQFSIVENALVQAAGNTAKCGGIAGINECIAENNNSGIIKGTFNNENNSTPKAHVDVTVNLSSDVSYAALGGVTGENKGTISDCSVFGIISGNLGNENYGYGGISGMSGEIKSEINKCSFDGTISANGNASAIANVGGITGKNLPQGMISDCLIGIKGGETKTEIKNGTSEAAFANLGGMVGWNQGTVTACDNEAGSNAMVDIIGYAGHCGGIVGYNDETAIATGTAEQKLSTGIHWQVLKKYHSDDDGTGGIFGYSRSGANIANVINHAFVSYTGSDSNATVGGIIGRLENRNTLDMKISDVVNYGTISANAIVGGIVGQVKYQGITIENSRNYGTVEQGTVAGGIMASAYMVTSGEKTVRIMECSNYGKISGNGGAIFGKTENSEGIHIILSDCINTGILSEQVSGIADTVSEREGYAAIYRCRNYGLGCTNGLVAGDVSTMMDCFSFSDAKNPIANGKITEAVDNYFVLKTAESIAMDENQVHAGENTEPDGSNVEGGLVSYKEAGKTTYQLWSANANSILNTALTGLLTDPMGSQDEKVWAYYSDESAYQNYRETALENLSYRYRLIQEIEQRLMQYYAEKYSEDRTE